jgi:hypothetical protein
MLPIRRPPNVSRRPTLITLQSTMMAVLAQCPEAKQAVLMALARHRQRSPHDRGLASIEPHARLTLMALSDNAQIVANRVERHRIRGRFGGQTPDRR